MPIGWYLLLHLYGIRGMGDSSKQIKHRDIGALAVKRREVIEMLKNNRIHNYIGIIMIQLEITMCPPP